MKFWIFSLLFSLNLFADGGKNGAPNEAKKKEMFEKAKSEAVANLEKRIKHLEETKSCVSSASDRETLKKCRMESRKRGESLRSEFKDMRQAKKEERMNRKKERMEKAKK